MDILEREQISKRWMEACNRCRMFLRAITISDISTASGNKILEEAIHCRFRLPSTLQWPIQDLPSKQDRSIWKQCLMKYMIGHSALRTLKQPLGRWFSDPALHHRVWAAGVSSEDNAVFIRNCHGWCSYSIKSVFRDYCIKGTCHHRALPPEFLIPAEVSPISEETIYYRGYVSQVNPPPPLLKSVPHIHWQDQQSESVQVTIHLFPTFTQCCVRLKQRIGYAKFTTAGKNHNSLVTSTLLCLRILANEISNQAVSIRSNHSTGKLERALQADPEDHRHRIHEENAIEDSIRNIVAARQLRLIFSKCENAEIWNITTEQSEWEIPLQVSLVHGDKVVHAYKKYLQDLPAALVYRQYLEEKYQLHREWDLIDWHSFQNSALKYTNRGPALIKYLHGWLAAAENVKHRSAHEIQVCPFCSKRENTSHLFQCIARERQKTISNATDKMWEEVKKYISPDITADLQLHMNAWMEGTEVDISPPLASEIQEQYQIGWAQFVRGHISDQFLLYIRDKLQQQGVTNPAKAAAKKIIRLIHALWDTALGLWKSRNEMASTDKPETPSSQRQRWISMAKFYYDNKHKFPEQDSHTIFSQSYEEIITKSDQFLSRWCRQVNTAFHQSISRATHLTRNTHRLITDFVTDTARPPG